MTSVPIVRTLYLYLFGLVGLVLLAIGSVRLVDMALRTFVFKQADAQERIWARQPPSPPLRVAEVRTLVDAAQSAQLTREERAALADWVQQYESWQELQATVDPVRSRRQREAATSIAMLLVGSILYFYHWQLIRRESRGAQA